MPPTDFNLVFTNLTENQSAVLDLACQHMTSKQIARVLEISPKTVDHRIDAVRDKCDHIPRSNLLRHYQAWMRASGKNPKDFSPIEKYLSQGAAVSGHTEPNFDFRDSIILDDRQSWDRTPTVLIAGIDIANLGSGARILAMLGGAVAIMLLVVLTFAAATALSTLLG